jgi:hypothetical protein
MAKVKKTFADVNEALVVLKSRGVDFSEEHKTIKVGGMGINTLGVAEYLINQHKWRFIS